MSDLPTLHSQARKLVISLRAGLDRLEAMEGNGGTTAHMAQQLSGKLNDLQRVSADMDGIWRMHVLRESPSNRDLWKRKVEQISEDVRWIQISLQRYGVRQERRIREQQEREELISRRHEGAQTAIQMDAEAQMATSINRSKTVLEETFEMGTNILENMTKNRDVLKRAQKRALDVINSVGLSESLLRLIERRQRGDVWLTYGGMVFILVVVVLLWWFFM